MDINMERRLVDSVLVGWPLERRRNVRFHVKDNCTFAYVRDLACGLVYGASECHPDDMFDMYTGYLYALLRLRVRFAMKERFMLLRRFVPVSGQSYFTVSFVPGCTCPDDLVINRVWSGDPVDYMYLSSGLVFRSFHLARKKARRLWYEGRNRCNLVKRFRVNVEDMPAVSQDEGLDCSVAGLDVVDPDMMVQNEASLPSTTTVVFCKNMDETGSRSALCPSERYYMDPVTGEIQLVRET